jgi:hypothetical protein
MSHSLSRSAADLRSEASGEGQLRGSAIARTFGRAGRYLGTYTVLLGDFAADRGWRFALLLALVVLAAIVYPLPFVLIGSLFLSAAGGSHLFELDLKIVKLSMGLDEALPGLVAFAAAAFLVNYLVGRLVNHEALRWQTRLLWRLVAEVPAIARPHRVVDIGGVSSPRNLARRVQQAIRSGFLIGRLVDVGLRDAIIILVSLGLMLVLDLKAVAAIAGVTLLFLPLYGHLLLGLATERTRHLSRLLNHMRALAGLIEKGVGARPSQRLDIDNISGPAKTASEDLIGFQGLQMNRLYGMNLVAGLHALAGLYAVFLVEGGTFQSLSPQHLSLFIVLLLLLRSVLGLVGLMSRLTRGYQGLALLRTFLKPRVKAISAKASGAGFRLEIAGEPARDLPPGSLLLLAAPQLHSTVDLVPLTNALVPLSRADRSGSPHVPLIVRDAAAAIRSGRIEPGPLDPLVLGEGARAPELPVLASPIELSRTSALALSAAAFAEVVAAGLGDAAREGRLLIVEESGVQAGTLPVGALLAVSDGTRIISVGPAEATAARFGEDLRRWRRKAARRTRLDEDEIDEDEI